MNILLITADQWRGDALGALGHPCARTPVLDRLAAESVTFTRHHGQATPCGPARASLLTGLYACNHRSITNGTPLDARHKTLATELGRAGYDCVLFGYTDASADPRTVPPDSPWLRTFEGVAPGFRVGLRLPEDVQPWLDHLAERGYGRLTREDVHSGPLGAPARFRAEDSETAFLADRFLAWLERAPARQPWLAHLTFLRPHPPLIAAEPWNSLIPPAATPPATRAPSAAEEAHLHPWLAAHLARPYARDFRLTGIERPADLDDATLARLRAVYFGLVARGRPPRRPRARGAGPPRPAGAHARRRHLRPRRDAGRPLDAREVRLLPPGLPRPAHRPRARRRPRPRASPPSPSTST